MSYKNSTIYTVSGKLRDIMNAKVARGALCAALLLLNTACTGVFSDDRVLNEDQLKRFNDAQTLYRNRKFDDARESLEKLLDERPGSVEVVALLARVRFFTREFDAAEELLRDYLDDDEHNPYALMWLGKTIAVNPERQAEAAEIFKQIVQRDPENYLARYYLGRTLEAQNQLKPALLEYQTALAMEYQVSKVHLHMGRLFDRLEMGDRARTHFQRVQALGVNAADIEAAESLMATEEPPAAPPQANRGRRR